jgi:integrase
VSKNKKPTTFTISTEVKRDNDSGHVGTLRALVKMAESIRDSRPVAFSNLNSDQPIESQQVSEDILWNWLRDELSIRPEFIAEKTGIPELATLRQFNLPKPSIRLAKIIEHYKNHNPSSDAAKRSAERIFNRFVSHTQAKTLADLSKTKIHDFQQSIENDADIRSAGTRKWMYGQIKSIISFGMKCPLFDEQEIRGALDRCKLLWTPEALPALQPKPIGKSDFHKLLDAASTEWKAWLLLGLNCAMYLEELCALEWSAIDLDRGTLAMLRQKTRRQRIPRAAVLWPETIEALKQLDRKPKYVFTAPSGTRYASSRSRCNAFVDLRTRANVNDDVTFAQLRDGAFTAACNGADERLAKVLAGHAAGMQDSYVLRSPEIVRPACDAVYRAYFPATEI